jgi:hypothetical protein
MSSASPPIDPAIDSPGPLQGIPDFLRITPEAAAERLAAWRTKLGSMPRFEAEKETARVRSVARDALATSVRAAIAEQATAKAVLLETHHMAAQALAARSYLKVGAPIAAAEYLAEASLKPAAVSTAARPVINPRGPSGPRLDGLTDAERATIDQYFAVAYPGWRITKQGGTPSFFLRHERTNKCVWIEPVFQNNRLSTKQAAVIREYAECGFKVEIVPVTRLQKPAPDAEQPEANAA